MNIGTLLQIAILLCTVSVGPLASAGLVTLINPGTDNRISTITGVMIAGTANNGLFDLTFHHNISYDTLQDNLDPTSPITWTTDAEAEVVLAAIKKAVNSLTGVTDLQTDDVSIPLVESLDVVTVKFGINQDSASYASWFFSIPPAGSSDQDIRLQPNDAWVTATAAVPEPNAFLHLGLVGLGCVAWPTRRANREVK